LGKFNRVNLSGWRIVGWLLLVVAVSACQSSPTATPTPAAFVTTVALSQVTDSPPTGYPLPTGLAIIEPYPLVLPQPTANLSPTPGPSPTLGNLANDLFLPFVSNPEAATPLPGPPTAVPSTVIPSPTPYPTIDITAVRAELAAQGVAFAPVKIGFHTGIGGNSAGLEQWMRALDAAGIPFFLKSVDNAQPIFVAQELMRLSGVPHVLVYRKSIQGGSDYNWNVPNYSLPANQAAEIHWQMHRNAFPPELDPSLVWLETINEVDKNESEWLGQFALKTAELALNDGFRWAAFGWASGEPEPDNWQTPSMLAFLRLAGVNPERLAIALHEYSYLQDDIGHEYPYKVGRFQSLFQIADQAGIPRPTVLITEWGWTYETVPAPEQALADIAWAAKLYAAYPQVKGAAIWFLGGGFADIAKSTQRLIAPVTRYSLQTYFTAPLPPAQAPIQPEVYQP
jgi:hypothetical protein